VIIKLTNFDGNDHNLRLEGYKSLFGSVIVGAFEITFCAKMHANDVFLFLKNYF
jgi:hypothetical protein